MRIFADQICRGELSEKAVPLAAYGIYLMNGGTREGFMNMNADDVQLIYTTYTAYQAAQTNNLSKIFAKMFGGE